MEPCDHVLHEAARNNQAETIKDLLDNKADINAVNDLGCSALHLAAINRSEEAVDILLERKADVHRTTFKQKLTPLHYAASAKSVEIIKKLIDYRAEVSPADSIGFTPLALAYAQGHKPSIDLLQDHSGRNLKRG